jgi:hypothetical protein
MHAFLEIAIGQAGQGLDKVLDYYEYVIYHHSDVKKINVYGF